MIASFLVGISSLAIGALAGDPWLGFGISAVSVLIYEIKIGMMEGE